MVTGASCFNCAVREQLKEAQEEVRRLIEVNCVLFADIKKLDEVVDSMDQANQVMH
jgi:hypothetical protein